MKSSVLSGGAFKYGNAGTISFALLLPILLIVVTLLIGLMCGWFGPSAWASAIGAMVLVILLALRQDELAAAAVFLVDLYVDWYMGLLVVAQVIALVLLVIFFLTRSSSHPWVKPRALWLWVLFLVIAISPAIRGATTRYDAAFYYPNIILGALIMFWLGTVIARDVASVRRFFIILAGVGTFLAVVTIIQATTGTLLFGSSRYDAELVTTANFTLATGSSVSRAGAFFVNPDWNGTFFATMLFIPFGLFVRSSSILGKVIYLAEMLLILPALLFTYSTGAWIGVLVGFAAFVLFVGSARYRVLLSCIVSVIVIVAVAFFPSQIGLQLQHITGINELSLRLGAWETGINVIKAFPLTGIGLGLQAYLQRAEPYRVPAQYLPLGHPHNSYIEIGAMAGLPVLCVFLVLLLFAYWQGLRNWVLLHRNARPLLAGAIAAVIALSANSWSINGWTFPSFAAIGWMVLGMISSPLLTKSIVSERRESKNNASMNKI